MRKYLLDSSVILEGLLLQAQAAQVQQLLMLAPPGMLCISDFSLHSIGLILTRSNLHNIFIRFVEDMILSGFLSVLFVPAEDLPQVVRYQQQFGLDFDDAYQYTVAEMNSLTIISFDSDFDRTIKGRAVPLDAIKDIQSNQ
jgi:predicted nucleic acid-binding protein